MNLTGSRIIAAERGTVWAALNDADILKACIPGCRSMTGTPAQGFTATVVQKVGPVKATFAGPIRFKNIVEGESYTITGGTKCAADVRLCDADGGGTELSYDVTANFGGKIAQLGGRIIDGFGKKVADGFFERFQTAVEEPDEVAAEAPAGEVLSDRKKGWLKRLVG